MISRFRTFIAGFLVLLPLAVTHTVIVWVGSFIYAYLGPDSAIGRVLISIGFNFSNSPIAAYALGAVAVVGLVYLLGLVVESRLESRVRSLIDSLMQRIPFLGNLYDVTKRFVAIVDRKNQDGLKSMSPDWSFFRGAVVPQFSDCCPCPIRSLSVISNLMSCSSPRRPCRLEGAWSMSR